MSTLKQTKEAIMAFIIGFCYSSLFFVITILIHMCTGRDINISDWYFGWFGMSFSAGVLFHLLFKDYKV